MEQPTNRRRYHNRRDPSTEARDVSPTSGLPAWGPTLERWALMMSGFKKSVRFSRWAWELWDSALERLVLRLAHSDPQHKSSSLKRSWMIWEGGFPGGSVVENLPANAVDTGDAGSIPALGRSPKGRKATHSSIFAWRISWTEEPGGLQSTESQKIRWSWTCDRSRFID